MNNAEFSIIYKKHFIYIKEHKCICCRKDLYVNGELKCSHGEIIEKVSTIGGWFNE